MGETKRYPFVLMRGGTSKGVFFRSTDLPDDPHERDEIVFKTFGSGDPRQIDGLGGADVLTSKLAIVGPSSCEDADVDYTFGQVGIGERVIDYTGNCGNISSAVGVYAIQEGFVKATEPETTVRVLNTNSDQILRIHVPVANGAPRVDGDYRISGVPGTGAEIRLDFSATAGAMTGKMLPTGSPSDEMWVKELNKSITVSIVDVAKPAAFFNAEEIGLTGAEGPDEFTPEILNKFQAISEAAAGLIGMDPSLGFPRPVSIAPPQSFRDFMTGKTIDESESDFLGRWVLAAPPRLHKAYAGTGAVCTGVAARLPGTVINALARPATNDIVRIGHPSGVFPIRIVVKDGQVEEASFSRTARRIMEGTVLIRS